MDGREGRRLQEGRELMGKQIIDWKEGKENEQEGNGGERWEDH